MYSALRHHIKKLRLKGLLTLNLFSFFFSKTYKIVEDFFFALDDNVMTFELKHIIIEIFFFFAQNSDPTFLGGFKLYTVQMLHCNIESNII